MYPRRSTGCCVRAPGGALGAEDTRPHPAASPSARAASSTVPRCTSRGCTLAHPWQLGGTRSHQIASAHVPKYLKEVPGHNPRGRRVLQSLGCPGMAAWHSVGSHRVLGHQTWTPRTQQGAGRSLNRSCHLVALGQCRRDIGGDSWVALHHGTVLGHPCSSVQLCQGGWGCAGTARHRRFPPGGCTKPQGSKPSAELAPSQEQSLEGMGSAGGKKHARKFPSLGSGTSQPRRSWARGGKSVGWGLPACPLLAHHGPLAVRFPRREGNKRRRGGQGGV